MIRRMMKMLQIKHIINYYYYIFLSSLNANEASINEHQTCLHTIVIYTSYLSDLFKIITILRKLHNKMGETRIAATSETKQTTSIQIYHLRLSFVCCFVDIDFDAFFRGVYLLCVSSQHEYVFDSSFHSLCFSLVDIVPSRPCVSDFFFAHFIQRIEHTDQLICCVYDNVCRCERCM